MWEKEKILVTNIFSISHNVFKTFLQMVIKSHRCVVGGKLFQDDKIYKSNLKAFADDNSKVPHMIGLISV